jgi:uncharacterized protein YndB with AHSA1/START domain
MSTTLGGTLTVTRQINARSDQVFSAWTDPAVYATWGAPDGVAVVDCTMDPRVGGAYHIHMRGPDGTDYNAVGVYRRVEPPHHLAFTWRWTEREQMPDSLVTLAFAAKDGGTLVTLTHSALSDDDDVNHHQMGWTSMLHRLEAAARAR